LYIKLNVLKESEYIKGCLAGDRLVQKKLYDAYAAVFFAIAKRYVKSVESAEDVLIEAFCKIFQKIDTYSFEGSFEGWMRRIVVNESLMYLRKNYRFHEHMEVEMIPIQMEDANVEEEISAREILALMDELPIGYRTVFNLFVVEGLKHKEIAEMLAISINTSKSQLILAKKRLRELYEKRNAIQNTNLG
jgi:RNA polymerase sigma factor (sigma-70 family)